MEHYENYGYGPRPGYPAYPQQQPYPGGTPLAPPPVTVVMPPRSGNGLAVIGVILGGLALLSAIVTGLVSMAALAFIDDPGPTSSGGFAPTTGTITPQAGGVLTGAALATKITSMVEQQGSTPSGITCAATPAVKQDVTTVCHGQMDGDDWSFVVFFEDTTGKFTLLEV